jgi:protease-4
MFTRRHPFLFFILVFTSVLSVALLGTVSLIVLGTRSGDEAEGEKVGVVEVRDIISDAKSTLEALKRFRDDPSVRAIVLRVDSPGGTVGPSQEIYGEVLKTVKTKKVVASLGSVAASGGYYSAAGSNGIMANPGTITGSIGVIMGFANFQELLQKIGLVPVVIKSGEFKDVGSPVRKMTDAEHEFLEAFARKIHRQFIRDVAAGRGLDVARVEEIADGRILTGEEAVEWGLVDRLGNLEDAVEWAGRMAGIKGKISTVYPPDDTLRLIKLFTESSAKAVLNRILAPGLSADAVYRP